MFILFNFVVVLLFCLTCYYVFICIAFYVCFWWAGAGPVVLTLAIIGLKGKGKSTFLKILGGVFLLDIPT